MFDRHFIRRGIGTTAVALVFGLAVAGCGDDDPVSPGDEEGEVSAVMTDGSNGAAASTVARNVSEGGATYNGTFQGSAQVQVSVDGEVWVDLGPPQQVTVQLRSSGDETAVHTNARVPAGTFTRVRLVLSGAQVNVAAGSVVGGITLTGAVTLTVAGGGQVVIEKQVPSFQVTATSRTTLSIDINSEAWMNENNVQGQAVSEAELEQATSVTVR